jgi:hypothetical protein
MEMFFIIGVAAVAGLLWFVRRQPANPACKSNDQLVREYTLYLHKIARSTRLNRLPLVGVPVHDSPAGRELEQRGFEPDRAIDEKFDAKKEGRSMDWDKCRLGPEGWQKKWQP